MEIISAKYLLTLDSDPIIDGALAIENGEILDVGTEEQLLARYKNASHEDFPDHAILPGLINAHSHLDMGGHRNFPFDPVRTMGVDVNFVDWLLSCIHYKKESAPDRYRAAVEEGIDACIESGTTCVGDMGSYEGIFQVLEQKGMRAVIFPEIISLGSQVTKDLFETALALVEKYMEYDSELIGVGIGPYAPFTLSRNILRIMAQYSRSSQIPLMIHAAESFSETEFFYNSTGDIADKLFPALGWGEEMPPAHRKTPIEYLEQIDFLAAKPIVIGAVNATPGDLERLSKWGAKVVWSPRAQSYLKLPVAPIGKMLAQKIPIALGTDGLPATNTLSMWDEMRAALETSRAQNFPLTPRDILAMATSDAAKTLGLEKEIGTLSVGKRADYLVVDAAGIPESSDIFDNLITQTRSYHVQKVVVNGHTLKRVN